LLLCEAAFTRRCLMPYVHMLPARHGAARAPPQHKMAYASGALLPLCVAALFADRRRYAAAFAASVCRSATLYEQRAFSRVRAACAARPAAESRLYCSMRVFEAMRYKRADARAIYVFRAVYARRRTMRDKIYAANAPFMQSSARVLLCRSFPQYMRSHVVAARAAAMEERTNQKFTLVHGASPAPCHATLSQGLGLTHTYWFHTQRGAPPTVAQAHLGHRGPCHHREETPPGNSPPGGVAPPGGWEMPRITGVS